MHKPESLVQQLQICAANIACIGFLQSWLVDAVRQVYSTHRPPTCTANCHRLLQAGDFSIPCLHGVRRTCVTGWVRPDAERTVQPKYSLKRPVDKVALMTITLIGEPASRLLRMTSLRSPHASHSYYGS